MLLQLDLAERAMRHMTFPERERASHAGGVIADAMRQMKHSVWGFYPTKGYRVSHLDMTDVDPTDAQRPLPKSAVKM